MSARNRRKKNRLVKKPKKGPGTRALLKGLAKGLLLCSAFLVSGLFFILVYDGFTQSDYFDAKEIRITGNRTLSREEIFRQAGIGPGVNVLSVNLALTRKRLTAHPWIAEASVERELPQRLGITIGEHRPMAIIDFNGSRFFINGKMELFKEVEEGEPEGVPVVRGLSPDELRVFGSKPAKESATEKREAVCRILTLGESKDSILPNRIIRSIFVDRDLGVDLVPGQSPGSFGIGMIRMGYGNYSKKYRRLEQLVRHLEKSEGFAGLKYVDLNNINGIVARPSKEDSAVSMEKEV